MTGAMLAELQQAAALLQRGDAAGALRGCEQILSRAPGDVEARHLRAMALARLGRIDEAAADFEFAAARHPRRDAVLVNFGNALKAAGRREEARDAYRRATAAAPNAPAAWNALGLAERLLNEPAAAEAAFEKALRLQANYAPALNNLGALMIAQERFDEAIGVLTKALGASQNPLLARLNRGAALRGLGRLEEARADHEAAASLAPNVAECAFQLGATLAEAGEYEAAVEQYRRAIALEPRRRDAHRDLARILWEMDRRNEAFLALDAAAEEFRAADLLVLRGEFLYRAGAYDEAARAARRALEMAPEETGAKLILALAAIANGATEEALKIARSAVQSAPGDIAALHALAEVELAAGLYADAAARLDTEPPPSFRQKHYALKAIALRAAGDASYRAIYDYDRFARQVAIEPPDGFATIESFNAALRAAIEPLHRAKAAPVDQTLFGGTQSPGKLWNNPHPAIQSFARTMLAAARDYVRSLPDDPAHPFLSQKSEDLVCAGAWSVMLSSGGGHIDHVHPAGWISASYYVDAPPEALGESRAGRLRLGASGVRGLSLEAERWFQPIPGTVVFFPSYMWHGVEPFAAPAPRITAPFDLAPRR